MSKYVTLADYTQFYSDTIAEPDFNRFVVSACQKADVLTTGIDGVKKLKVAFPVVAEDIEVVKAAICGVIHLMNEIATLESAATSAQGYITREDGTVVGKTVTSISSGSESISYSASASGQTMASSVAGDSKAQNEAYNTILEESFRGVDDANGVHLMYMGIYPVDVSEVDDV